MLDALAELAEFRALDRARQDDRRLDRERKVTRRGIEANDNHGLTVRELDRHRDDGPDRAARNSVNKLIEAGLVQPRDADQYTAIVTERLREAVWTADQVAGHAWHVALCMLSPSDWEPGRYVLTAHGLARFALTAARAAHTMLGGQVAPAAVCDGWWLASWRGVLADHELGMVLAAMEDLDGGPRASTLTITFVDERPDLPSLRDLPALAEALDDHADDDPNVLARIVAERWRRLRRAGWRDIRGDHYDDTPAISAG